MTSEYLKQLQLTKQLEQKAKDAAKNRRSAEEKLSEAEKAVGLAQAMGADVKDVLKKVADGRAAFAKRDYSVAILAADEARTTIEALQGGKVRHFLSAAESILAMIDDRGDERKEVEELLGSSRQALEENRLEEALNSSQAALTATEAYADHRMSDMFAQVKRAIDLAEKEGMAIAAKRQALTKAMKLHKDGDLEGSLTKLAACFKSVQSSFSKLVDERTAYLLEMAEQVAGGGDITPVSCPVERARDCLAHGRFDETLFLLGEAQKALNPLLASSVQDRLTTQLPRSYWLREQGVNITRFATASKKATEAAKAGQSEEALEWLRRSEKALRDGEAEVVLRSIDEMRPRLAMAKRLNMDLTPVLNKLEDSRQHTVMGYGAKAMEAVQQASADLDEGLCGFWELEKELERTREVFLEARGMKIVSQEAGEMVRSAREAALAGRMMDTVAGLTQARAVLLRTVHDQFGRKLLDNELMLAAGLSMGAPIDDDAEELEELEDDLREGCLEDIAGRLSALNQALDEALMTASRMAVTEADQVTSGNYVGANLSPMREKTKQAHDLMEGREWYRAFNLAQEAVEEANAMKKGALSTLREQTGALLDIGRQLGVDQQTIEMWRSAMSSDDADPTESLRSIGEIYNHARVTVKEELIRAFAQLTRSSSIARRKGVTTDHVEQLVEEGGKALGSFDLEASFNKYQAAERELEQTSAMHNEVYDLIVLLSRLTSEIQVPLGSKIQPLLMETKRLFEAGLYDGARTSARNCYREAETVGAHILAPRKVQEVHHLLPVLRQLGIGTEQAEGEIRNATELLRKGEAATAMARLKDVQKAITDQLTESIQGEIDQLRTTLDEKDLGRDELNTLAVVEKTERLLDDHRFSDALQAIRFARSETMQALNVMRIAQKELARAEWILGELSSSGIQIKDARAVLEQAVKHRSSGRFNLVAEMARKAEHTAWAAAEAHVKSKVEDIEMEMDIATVQGPDLEATRSEVMAKVARMAEHRNYADAEKILERYRTRLHSLLELKERCTISLARAAASLAALPTGSLLVAETARLEAQARKAWGEGAYHQCGSLLSPCLASARAATAWHESCSRRLREVHDRLDSKRFAGIESSSVAVLLDSAVKALAEGRYEDMDRSLLQAERTFDRERRRQVRQGLSELKDLGRLLPSLGIATADLPAEAVRILGLHGEEAEESDITSVPIETVRAMVRKAIEERFVRIKAKVEKKGDGGTVRNILAKAERSLAENRLEQAVSLMLEADLMAGATLAEVLEMRELTHRYQELESYAMSLGLNGEWAIERRSAMTAKDMAEALEHMRRSVASIDLATAAHLPALVVDSAKVSNTGNAPALTLVMDGMGAKDLEVNLTDVLWPQSSVELPSPQDGQDKRVTLSYRALFVPQPLAAVLEHS